MPRHLSRKLFHIFAHHEFIYLTLIGNAFIGVTAGLFYALEAGVNTSVSSYQDALWWAVVTITTVGYGDVVPVTGGGRLLAYFTMIFGMAIFACFTGIIVQHFLSEAKQH